MKSRLALFLCLSVLPAAGCARSRGADESFPVFLDRFIREEGFRASRTTLPLLVLVGSPSEDRSAQTWTAEQFKEKFTVPVLKGQLQSKGLVESTLTSTPVEVELLQSIPRSNGYKVKYRFELENGRWFLTYFEDSSY